jgi:LuxR family maltose regulon positive regulatory protein
MADIRFQLKTAPPRLGRTVAVRRRLEHRWAEINDRTAIVVTAPQGFGKTTLLAQWRRNWLGQGAYVAWASLDAQDDRARFVELLLFALRTATGRESFAIAATQGALQENRELDALTALLAEVAVLATPAVLVLDDVHRMPQATMREVLAYLLNNAPPNLHLLIGSRRPLELPLTDLLAAGRMASVTADDLRLGLDEALDTLRARFGMRIGLDDAVRLHDLTEGWPLGLQLAAAAIERATDLHVVIGELSARRGDIHRFFFESLLAQLPPEEAAFLVRVSILEVLSVEVCTSVTGSADAPVYLERLSRESPIVTEGESRDWLRLHAMARDFLLGQFDKLPAEERRGCHERAAAWYAARGQLQDAARHALAAGDDALAVAHVSRCLRDIAREGRLAEARDWMRRLPPHALSMDVRLQLTVAWITALDEAADTVPTLIEQAARHPQFDDFCRFEAAVISAAAATYRDQPGRIAEALRDWDRVPEEATPLHLASLANSRAHAAVQNGDLERARQILAAMHASSTRVPAMRLPLGFGDAITGVSYLWEGNPAKAVALLQPRLEQAERDLGRRSTVAAMLAGPLAGALFLLDETDQALATLADRLDVIERLGMPDSIILAYRSLAGIALRRGEEARALDLLAALHQLGVARGVPRMSLMGLTDQVRLHALRGRVQTACELLAQLEAMAATFEQTQYRAILPLFRQSRALATACVCIAKSDLDGAETALDVATEASPSRRRGPLILVARALRALVAHDRGRPEEARDLLAEVLGLAELTGMRRYVEEVHPRLAEVIASGSAARGRAEGGPSGAAAHERVPAQSADGPARMPAEPVATPATGGLLTPKEARILSMLALGRANKEIARAMDIGEQTVKWHLKNVFFKLNAASRKHAVDRARLLGLLEG